MLSRPTPRPLGRLLFAVLGQGLSTGMGFAALGLALYAQGPAQSVTALFGVIGLLCGMASAIGRLVLDGVPAALPTALPAEALASLVRATLAQAQQQRKAKRSGLAADGPPATVAEPRPGLAADTVAPVPVPRPVMARGKALPTASTTDSHRLAGEAAEAGAA